jgi:hypothetical protein
VAATDGTYSAKVVVTWTKSTGATGYQVYRDGSGLDWLGDVATYNDTGAGAPTITPGSSIASDGTYTDKVALSLSGAGTSQGTTHTYKVVAKNAGGNSTDSNTDTGYRAPGALTYQWQRSAADSDAAYSDIVGATAASYNDTGAPADGSGRYYKCVEDAAGASQQISSADRGYRAYPTIEITAPADITGITSWALSPSGTQPQTTTGTLNVTCSGDWEVTVEDADTDTGGKMTDWSGSAYNSTTKLANFMKVAADSEVTLPAGGTIASGNGNASVEVTFKQTVSWSDQVLPEGHSYRIIVTFTGTAISP